MVLLEIPNDAEFIYRNMKQVSKLAMTMDTHTAEQIFHEEFFVNENGDYPTPMSQISNTIKLRLNDIF
jgi:hypothetical protein